MIRTTAPHRRAPRTVSAPHEPAEREADRAADVVARGGSVTGWSFARVAPEASVHREEKKPGGPKSDEEKVKEAAGKTAEALLETKPGKAVQEKIKNTPGLREPAAAGLLLAGKDVPLPIPGLPEGLGVSVRAEGLTEGAPTYVGASLTFTESAAKKKGPSDREKYAAETARLRARLQTGLPKTKDDADSEAAIAYVVAQQSKRFGTTTLVPLLPGAKPKTVEAPPVEEKKPEKPEATEEKKPDEAPVQREPASTATAEIREGALPGVDDAVRGGGRALEPALRHSMESRFGHDFSSVRLHDDAGAAGAAAGVAASAFTVGEHVVFGTGGFDPNTPAGRRLLAHELAHVVQQRGARSPRTTGAPARVQRRGIGEWLGIFFGTIEGDWSDRELRAYLDQLTKTKRIDGAFDADNKARAIVRKWKAGTAGWQLSGAQKALLIDEMLDGPTLDDDEKAILDLLERSDAGDLREIFRRPAKRYSEIESNLHYAEDDRWDAFVTARFFGGATALKAGTVSVKGPPIPSGAPRFAFDEAYLVARIHDQRTSATDVIALVERWSPADRGRATAALRSRIWPTVTEEHGQVQRSLAEVTGVRKQELDKRLARLAKVIRKLNVVLGRLLAGDLPKTEADLRHTKPLTAQQGKAAEEALVPKLRDPLPEDRKPKKPKKAKKPKTPDASGTTKPGAPKATAPDKDEEGPDTEEVVDEKAEELRKFGPASDYRKEIQAAIVPIILDKYDRHTTAGTRVPSSKLEPLAQIAKDEVDDVFGAYYHAGDHDLTFGTDDDPGNIHSWYETHDRELRAMKKPEQLTEAAISRVMKYFQTDSQIRGINAKHGATAEFDKKDQPENEVARTLVLVAREVTKAGPTPKGLDDPKSIVDKLNATYRLWGGVRRGDEVFVDVVLTGEADDDRRELWDALRTFVHEYLHTLRDDDYTDYAKTFGRKSAQYNTLIEGVDDVFTGMVWARIAAKSTDPTLRRTVEGAAYAALPPLKLPDPPAYPSIEEAHRLIGVAGLPNLLAAYFLGLVDRIRGPEEAKAGKAGAKPGTTGAKAGKPGPKPGKGGTNAGKPARKPGAKPKSRNTGSKQPAGTGSP